MIVLNEENQIVTNPDLESGYLMSEDIRVVLTWIIDVPEITETYVKREYPNGGKDIGRRVTQEEQGHWKVIDDKGNSLDYIAGIVPDGIPHDRPVTDVYQIQRYIPYTQEELERRNAELIEEEAAKAKAKERDAMLDDLPDTLESTDDAICTLYEMVINSSDISPYALVKPSNPIAGAYSRQIKRGKKTIYDVPESMRSAVEILINEEN